ncbi:MAG TPA: GGDEF domain-containing protein [Petrotogaceae bacterium]|nr:GGDEF domain-containing protein [Petrotogaceae bacterium]
MQFFQFMQVYIVSIGLLTVILLKILHERDYAHFQNKLFAIIVAITINVLIVEALGWRLDGIAGSTARLLLILDTVILMIITLYPGILWIMYLHYQLHHNKKRTKKIWLWFSPAIVYITILSLTAPVNGLLFYVDEMNRYHRGSWYWQAELLYFGFFLIGLMMIVFNKKKIPKSDFYTLITFPLIPFIGTLIQMLFYGMALAWNSVSISLLIIYINIQSRAINSDYLTGLYNRRRFENYFEDLTRIAFNKKFLLLMLDVDNFKRINDKWGHRMGDRALEKCALILKKCFHNDDFIARYGGDEFVVLLEIKNEEDIEAIIRRLKSMTAKYPPTENQPFEISFSIGHALYPKESADPKKLFQIADSRMYEEKRKLYLRIKEN